MMMTPYVMWYVACQSAFGEREIDGERVSDGDAACELAAVAWPSTMEQGRRCEKRPEQHRQWHLREILPSSALRSL